MASESLSLLEELDVGSLVLVQIGLRLLLLLDGRQARRLLHAQAWLGVELPLQFALLLLVGVEATVDLDVEVLFHLFDGLVDVLDQHVAV